MANTTQERQPAYSLRRFCSIAGSYQDADDSICGMNDCLETRTYHKLRLRRMLICEKCEQGYFNRADYDCHECYSGY